MDFSKLHIWGSPNHPDESKKTYKSWDFSSSLKPIICTEKYFPSLGSLIVKTKKIQNGPNIVLFITIFLSKAKENGMMYDTEKEKNWRDSTNFCARF